MDLFSGFVNRKLIFFSLSAAIIRMLSFSLFIFHFNQSIRRVVQRMEYALRNLITFPQNNFRLFINGKLVYTDANRIEDLHDILNGCFANESR